MKTRTLRQFLNNNRALFRCKGIFQNHPVTLAPRGTGREGVGSRCRKISHALILPVLLLLTILQSSAQETNSPSNWVSLFNGSDLKGWVPVNAGYYAATNGLIHLSGGKGWLRTEREYTNFIFEADWRALGSNYNSGFFIRAGLEGAPFPTNVWQVNLKRSALGELLRGSQNFVPSTTPPMPLNQWVKFRIEARGKDVFLDVDGKRAWEFHNLDVEHGCIGLQAEGYAFDFRNLRVQALP
jgi:hypothetical protein